MTFDKQSNGRRIEHWNRSCIHRAKNPTSAVPKRFRGGLWRNRLNLGDLRKERPVKRETGRFICHLYVFCTYRSIVEETY